MTEIGDATSKDQSQNGTWWMRQLLPLFGVGGVLITIVLLYFGYDYVSARANACEAIFRQTKLGLSTKIGFLKSEGELKIGREPLVELTERAQMTALNLKTCCTVLDAGKLDPEQFLQCKAKARAYDARVGEIVTVVRKVVKVEAAAKSKAKANATSVANATTTASPKPTLAAAQTEIKSLVEDARTVSRELNKDIVAVRKAQALEKLEILPPRHVDVSGQESEPNNDALNTNVVNLEKWIKASVGAKTDSDYYSFETPPVHRDWITIELENRSTSLRPRIELFNADKSGLGAAYNTTHGANLKHRFVAPPATRYIARVKSHYGESVGAYLLRIVPQKAYDTHEPNNRIFEAKPVTVGKPVTGGVMDHHDRDFFRITTDANAKNIQVKLSNQSTTLRPRIELFDANKSNLGGYYNTTHGGDTTAARAVVPESDYYILIKGHYGESVGAYEFTVTFTP